MCHSVDLSRHFAKNNKKLTLTGTLTATLIALKANATDYTVTDNAVSCHHILLLQETVRLLHHVLKLNTFIVVVITSLPLVVPVYV